MLAIPVNGCAEGSSFTTTGTSAMRGAFTLPTWPSMLSPQHTADVSANTAHASFPPSASWVTFVNGPDPSVFFTSTGNGLHAWPPQDCGPEVVPIPNCPYAFPPQQRTVPSPNNAQESFAVANPRYPRQRSRTGRVLHRHRQRLRCRGSIPVRAAGVLSPTLNRGVGQHRARVIRPCRHTGRGRPSRGRDRCPEHARNNTRTTRDCRERDPRTPPRHQRSHPETRPSPTPEPSRTTHPTEARSAIDSKTPCLPTHSPAPAPPPASSGE